MKKKKKNKAEKYHDRVAKQYDRMYEGSRYWDFYRELTWSHLKNFIPESKSRVLDAGCGTGVWGLRLARGGHQVTFMDVSSSMLDRAEEKARQQGVIEKCSFVKDDLEELESFSAESIELLLAQGDPLSCVKDPQRAIRSVYRILSKGGKAVFSVDGLFGGIFFFLERGEVKDLQRFLKKRVSHWQTKRKEERFPTRAFSAKELRELFSSEGFEILSLIGKPVFPIRRFRQLLENRQDYLRLLRMEMKYRAEPELLGGAPHLEVAVSKPSTEN